MTSCIHLPVLLTEGSVSATGYIFSSPRGSRFAYGGICAVFVCSSSRRSWIYLMATSSVFNLVGFLPILSCPIARCSSSYPWLTFFILTFSLVFFSTRFRPIMAALALSALVLFRRPLCLPLLHAPTTPSRLGMAIAWRCRENMLSGFSLLLMPI